jgi:hypothetical protein
MSELIDKVARDMYRHEFAKAPGKRELSDDIPEVQEHFRASAKAAVAVVLQEQMSEAKFMQIFNVQRFIEMIAHENGIKLDE